MFYNAPIIPACREYKGKYWSCSRLPFGIQPAPYFAMRLMKVVMEWIRKMGIACWCHKYHIILTGNYVGYLAHVTEKVIERLKHVDWKISEERSVLRPSERIENLGVYVSVRRHSSDSEDSYLFIEPFIPANFLFLPAYSLSVIYRTSSN